MFSSTLIAACLLISGGAALAAPPPAPKYDGHELASQAKISIQQAEAIALKARPGAVVERELEKEHGGSGLRFGFIIKDGETKYEVGIDAVTGKMLENSVEGDDAD